MTEEGRGGGGDLLQDLEASEPEVQHPQNTDDVDGTMTSMMMMLWGMMTRASWVRHRGKGTKRTTTMTMMMMKLE